ncbi:MAG: ZPR1 zinc finger domain-containing protein [Methanobrevibacter thaueri]|jgi:zinc finger protein|uniref:ZPR1 zinc finger domain-containing protein n=1 Tax=Methanobrevibacter thaueri TaxID=190975 RepID=UPI0026F06E87|nr:ZPR1 zinc finger domain-containing protein [Methanobrevibacter thaueri]MBE6495426.1 ZPR1 zinc finger domain-containing protein [Methanobrevibacter thaueri]
MNDETINEMIIKCPACGIEGVAKSIMKELEIPHFGKVMETTLQCPSCGFRHSDVLALEHKDPAKHVIEISKNTLSVRVVRSQSATVMIPEAGIKVEPGPKSEGYVTNVEGVLTRFESAVIRALNLFDDELSQKNGKGTLEFIQELKKGNGTATLIMLDPFGQSSIVSDKAEVSEIPEDELKGLKTGFSIIEDE